MKYIAALLLVVIFSPMLALAAIAYDTSFSDTQVNKVSSRTYSFTGGSGSDRLLLVWVGTYCCGASDTLTSVTYNGVAMTRAEFTTDTIDNRSYLYYLAAPATGANNVVITLSAAHEIYSMAWSYTGVDQTTPIDSHASLGQSTNNTSITQSTTVVASDAWVVAAADSNANTINYSTGLNASRAAYPSGGYWRAADTDGTVSPGSYSVTFTGLSSGRNKLVMASLKPAGGGGGGGAINYNNDLIIFE